MRPSFSTQFTLSLGLLAVAACGSDDQQATVPDASPAQTDAPSAVVEAGGTVDVQSEASIVLAVDGSDDGGSATGMDGAAANTGALRGIVVVSSDNMTSSVVSFLDLDGNLAKDGCFGSNTGKIGLFPALSGDVALPSQIPAHAAPVIIDRSQDVLTWLDPATCAPSHQLSVATGFHSNPHDVVPVSTTKAYVTRFEENRAATPDPADFDEGSDLVIIDLSQPAIVGRVDLKPFAPSTKVLPRADRALLAEGKVFVSLNAISADFKAYGAGRVVVVDPATDQVVGTIDLLGLMNCGAMTYLPASRKVLVVCGGSYADGPKQVNSSGVAIIDLATSPPTLSGSIAASPAVNAPLSNGAVAAFDEGSILVATPGDFSGTPPDRMWSLSASGDAAIKVFESSESYSIGAVLADGVRGRAVLADGPSKGASSVQFFVRASGAYTLTKTVNPNPSQKLPARALAWY